MKEYNERDNEEGDRAGRTNDEEAEGEWRPKQEKEEEQDEEEEEE
jgi:hypothetical protein